MAKKRKLRQAQVTWYGDDYQRIIEAYGPEALFYAGEIVQREAERRINVGPTGNLRRSGYVNTKWRTTFVVRRWWRKQQKATAYDDAVIAFSAPHAHLVEGGRRGRRKRILPRKAQALLINGQYRSWTRVKRMAARPFLGPAIDATATTMVEELAKRFRGELERLLPGR